LLKARFDHTKILAYAVSTRYAAVVFNVEGSFVVMFLLPRQESELLLVDESVHGDVAGAQEDVVVVKQETVVPNAAATAKHFIENNNFVLFMVKERKVPFAELLANLLVLRSLVIELAHLLQL
jgi:hypothetical protein